MATIIKREGKKGVSYKIQVAIKDVGLGKMVTKLSLIHISEPTRP